MGLIFEEMRFHRPAASVLEIPGVDTMSQSTPQYETHPTVKLRGYSMIDQKKNLPFPLFCRFERTSNAWLCRCPPSQRSPATSYARANGLQTLPKKAVRPVGLKKEPQAHHNGNFKEYLEQLWTLDPSEWILRDRS